MEGVEDGSQPAVCLFYHYEPVRDADAEAAWQREFLTREAITGRLRVAPAGLNGTLTGTCAALERYKSAVGQRFELAGKIDWKLTTIEETQRFDALMVRRVDEVVSLGVPAHMAPLEETAKHILPAAWHALLEGAASGAGREAVLLDTRNVYEWRIGHFQVDGVTTLLPPLRQFSELPAWIDANLDLLKGRQVFAYCTGGVRCESATAYLRHKDPIAFADAVQLEGGIERYLQAQPSGGFFRGKNLVFDKRRSVGAGAAPNSGMQAESADGIWTGEREMGVIGRCLQCAAATDDYSPQCRCARCRLLLLICPDCAHSPRSNGVDAAASSRFLCESCASAPEACEPTSSHRLPEDAVAPAAFPGRPLRLLCLHGFRQSSQAFSARLSQLQRKLKGLATLEFCVQAPHVVEGGPVNSTRRCWLHTPEEGGDALNCGTNEPSPLGLTAGWDESLATLTQALTKQGPFDGVLGLSQGAAVAAALVATLPEPRPFRFVVLCAGFIPRAPVALESLHAAAPLRCPSLHIVGRSDLHVEPAASARLYALFDPTTRQLVEHDGGHIIPATDKHVNQYKDFLRGRVPSGSSQCGPPCPPPPDAPPGPPEVEAPHGAEGAESSSAPTVALPQRVNRRRRQGEPSAAASDATCSSAAEAEDVWATRDPPKQHEYLDHTADIQLHAWGASLEEAFEQQVLAVMGLITEAETVQVDSPSAHRRQVSAEGHDVQSLLFNFLDEWLFQFNAELFVCRRVKITLFDRDNWRIESVGIGEPFELGRHPQGIEVKAITYSALRVTEDVGRTDVLVIVDV